ncbi:MAG: ABC transporter ATP-binding protein [Gammaproteobacteria bacterium]
MTLHLSVHDVSHGFQSASATTGRLTILESVNLSVHAGESVAIVGPSGAGKSTLLGLLAGLEEPTEGRITLLGTELSGLSEDARAALRAGQVGFVFQSFQLLPGLTALENVLLPLELAGSGDARDRARSALEMTGLGGRINHMPHQLSGGEQQRVALARAFAPQPRLLFADEPTGNLDRDTGHQIAEILFDLQREQNTTLVLVTHDLSLADACDRKVRISDGSLEVME